MKPYPATPVIHFTSIDNKFGQKSYLSNLGEKIDNKMGHLQNILVPTMCIRRNLKSKCWIPIANRPVMTMATLAPRFDPMESPPRIAGRCIEQQPPWLPCLKIGNHGLCVDPAAAPFWPPWFRPWRVVVQKDYRTLALWYDRWTLLY